jgi:hypothetical protein
VRAENAEAKLQGCTSAGPLLESFGAHGRVFALPHGSFEFPAKIVSTASRSEMNTAVPQRETQKSFVALIDITEQLA